MSDGADEPRLTDANADLMQPLLALLRESDKDLPTKVGVLVDAAAALLATSERLRLPSELRAIAEEMRKRLIQATRLHMEARDARADAATKLAESGLTVEGVTKPGADVVKFPVRTG
jgi:hypothetical protein